MSKIDDIFSVLKGFGDSVSLIGADNDFAKIAKTANFDFYKFRNEIVGLVRHGVRTGYSIPATCGLEIRNTNDKDIFSVTIDVFFLLEEGRLQKISKNYSIFGFSYLPDSISDMLEKKGIAKVAFSAAEIQEIVMNMEKEVYDSRNRSLLYWIRKTINEATVDKGQKFRVKIDDMVLYYRARLYSISSDIEEQYLSDFLVAHLVELYKLVEKPDIDSLQKGQGICFDITIN